MNRIILIGNGFDLAHGMKTSYRDFIDDYWVNVRERCKPFIMKKYEDDEILIPYVSAGWQEKDCYNSLMEESKWKRFTVTFKNRLIGKFSKIRGEVNWVDIEDEYYKLLKKAYRNNNSKLVYEIQELNKDFLVVQKLLEEYLTKEEKKFESLYQSNYHQMHRIKGFVIGNIYKAFDAKDFNVETKMRWNSLKGNEEDIFVPANLLFLNFNYTDTHEYYTTEPADFDIPVKTVQIHGRLNSKNNRMIFGFGDELDEDYKEIENLNDNNYLENIKSIKYLESTSYKELLNFINSDRYQIFIFGHSCGNSDRTLLNTLFEHENCCSIKPFYRQRNDGTDNYSEIVRNISRSFRDKAVMRDKVVNKAYCTPLFKL